MTIHRYTLTKAYFKAATELLPSLTSIFLGDLLLVYVFFSLGSEKLSLQFFAYAFFEALALFCLGKLSDKWSRKKALLMVHLLALPLLVVLYFYVYKEQIEHEELKNHIYLLLMAGLIYSPGPPCRAIIVDNFRSTIIKLHEDNFYNKLNLTETRLIGISWIAQYLPWALSPLFALVDKSQHLFILIILMGLNIPFLVLRLKDAMEKSLHTHHQPFRKSFSRSPFTLSGLFLAQIVFWAVFDKIDLLQNREFVFSMVGIGASIGTILSMLHRKTPHITAITDFYQLGFVFCIISSIFSYYFNDQTLLTFQLIVISLIGGFYLPFVYDIVVSKGGAEHRATMFACTEVVQGISSVFGMVLITVAGNNLVLLFSVATVLYMGAHLLQTKEKVR